MPWQKGQTGNPKGRPPNIQSVTRILHEMGDEEITIDGKRTTRIRAAAERLWTLALHANDINCLIYLINRLDGKPKAMQVIETVESTSYKVILVGKEAEARKLKKITDGSSEL